MFADLLNHVLAGVPLPKLKPGLYLALHSGTDEPTDQDDNELTYPGYERVAIPRSTECWMVDDEGLANRKRIEFPRVRGSTREALTWVTIGSEANGAGRVLWSWRLAKPTAMLKGTIPAIEAGDLSSDFRYSED